jgi:aminopeptidase N
MMPGAQPGDVMISSKGKTLAAIALAALAANAGAADPAPVAPPRPPALRLPTTVTPRSGALDLTVDPSAERYGGVARYDVTVAEPTRVVWLHAEGLEIRHAFVGGRPARPVLAPGGFLGLELEEPLPPGEAVVEIDFSGAFDRVRSRGLYAVPEGDRWYAYTFFQPQDGRRAFPAFDEPRFKIPWRISLRVPEGDVALANAPLASETAEGRWRRFTFAESRPLPSEVVAFVVGPFDLVDGGKGGAAGVPIRFAVPKGRGAETRYAVEVTPRILAATEAVLGRPYPYEKFDVAVVPRFWGTMEHPGLVALGQPLTLIPPAEETRERKEAYASIAIHELAHFWYGDLVTPAWWDDLWLNESFATWEDANVTDRLEPSWRILAEARWRRRAQAMEADAVPSAKRLREPVTSAHDVDGAFDNGITYAKGASVISMYEAFLGPDRWRAVVQDHLDARAYRTATSDDFLAALAAVAGADVAGSLRGFLDQPGVPVLRTRVTCGKGGAAVEITQERFLDTGPADRTTRWTVPVCLRAGNGNQETKVCGLVPGPKGKLSLPFCPAWTWPNASGTGYFLTALAPGEARRLWPHLTGPERLALATDARMLARRGDLPVGDALSLVEPLARDPDRLQVEASLLLLSLAQPDELPDGDHRRYQAFLRRTYGDRARALGWLPRADDGEDTRALRLRLLPVVAGRGAEPALDAEARSLALRWLADRGSVPAEIAGEAVDVAALRGDRALLDLVSAEADRTADRAAGQRLHAALGMFEDPALARLALERAVAPGSDLRDTRITLQVALPRRATRVLAWRVLRDRWDDVAGRLRADEATWIIEAAAAAACDPARRAEVAAFFGPRAAAFEGAPRALVSALERADTCIAARKRNGAAISRFLAPYGR